MHQKKLKIRYNKNKVDSYLNNKGNILYIAMLFNNL